MRFFTKSPSNSASSFVTPHDFTITLVSKNGKAQYYGPGAIIQGQVQLSLAKPITSPCQLQVIFACHQTILPHALSNNAPERNDTSSQEEDQSTLLFEVENLLLDNQILPACRKQGAFHFSIKMPLCSYPPSIEDGQRSINYSIHAQLCFETDPGNSSSRTSVSSNPIKVMYLPLVPTVVPNSSWTAPPTVTAVASLGPASTPTFETNTKVMIDTTHCPVVINASVKCKTGVCIGEFISLILEIENLSHIDLQSIHLALVRQISYAIEPSSDANPTSRTSPYTYTTPDSTTIHNVTIPVAKVSNAGSSWNQQLQLKVPTDMGLTPSIGTTITPLLKVDYFVLVSIPIPQRHNSLIGRLISSTRKRPHMDLSIFNASPSTLIEAPLPSPGHASHTLPRQNFDQTLPLKVQAAIQFTPIPIVVGTVPSHNCHKKLKWPIPNYLEVTDRPKFVRDRFEEEMVQHLSSLESLIMEEDDVDIDELVQAARKSSSSEESDEDDDCMQSRVPARFRSYSRATAHTKGSLSFSGLGTPPPSPPQEPTSMIDDVHLIHSLTESSAIPRGMQISSRVPRHRSTGLGKDLLVTMHHNKMHQ
ncbi:hypothetical protein BGX27_002347 [Mortierella sp. AM989]|nr:hypothetical protein BGX27_002347 [Mortierella sp. AM989]